jgi:uncharacterized protein
MDVATAPPSSVSAVDPEPERSANAMAPISSAERIVALDVVRGVAVLGILLMNIVGFGLHAAAYGDPTVAGGATGINFWIYAVNAVLVDGKMRGIFSLMFGAGVMVLTSRLAGRGTGPDAADIHYRRMYWLLLLGVLHAYFLWWGEILYPYALLGLFLYPMRRLSPKGLIITATVTAVLLTGMAYGFGFRIIGMRDEAAKADAALASGQTLTEKQLDAQREYRNQLKQLKPDAAELKRVNDAFGGTFGSALTERAKMVAQMHFTPYYFPPMWDMLCMMLFGMAFVTLGILSAERSYAFYARMAAIGYAVGLPLHIWMVWRNVQTGFDPHQAGFTFVAYEPARIAVCFAHIAVAMMIVKAGALRWITAPLAAVGQMALTNYLLQSIICSTIFYGYGFNLFGKLERYQLYYVVLGCWIVGLVLSPIWLRHYRFGPAEWCWRSLTYWKRQPMRLAPVPAPVAVEAVGGQVMNVNSGSGHEREFGVRS